MKLFGRDFHQPKGYRTGTHRACSPAETLRRFAWVMPELQITRLADITGLDTIGLPVYVAVRPNSRSLATTQGKGWDRDSAKVSAMMEAVESWHGENARGRLCYDSYQSLVRKSHVVDASICPLRPGAVFRTDAPYLWFEGWDLLAEKPCWVPYELVTTNFVPTPGRTPVFLMSSNGQASGNHLLEAVVHGLCELIERDAQALWSLGSGAKTASTKIDLSTVSDPLCLRAHALLASAGVELAVWDSTSDIGIPAYSAGIVEREHGVGPAGGYGCHLAPEVALMRAVSEAVQSRATVISGSRDDTYYRDYSVFLSEDTMRQSAAGVEAVATRPFDRASLATDSFEGDVAVLLENVRRAGIASVVVCDLTDPAIGIPVVKVIAPGLEGLRERLDYQPGMRARAVLEGAGAP